MLEYVLCPKSLLLLYEELQRRDLTASECYKLIDIYEDAATQYRLTYVLP